MQTCKSSAATIDLSELGSIPSRKATIFGHEAEKGLPDGLYVMNKSLIKSEERK